MRKVLLFVFLAAIVAAPVAALPRLSLHSPTLSAAHSNAHDPLNLPGLAPGIVSLGAAIKVKDVGSIARKFVTRAQAASQDYASGVQGAGQDWQNNTLAGEGNYEAGVQEAIAKKRFGKGVSAAGAQKYTENATKLGPQRFQTGVAQAETAFSKGVAPVLDTLRGIDLPPRGPKGSPQNQQRAQVVAARLRAMKVGS